MFQYEIVRTNRRTVALSVTQDLRVIVRAPLRTSQNIIHDFVLKHEAWVAKSIQKIKTQNEIKQKNALTEQQIELLRNQAKQYLPGRVAYYSGMMNVVPSSIKITSAKTRWGSCSSKDALCFPYRIMLLPSDIIDYIVVHELSHITEKNHGVNFYKNVQQYLPDYKERERQLREIQKVIP